jgi:Flp pilus assembly protein TadD
MTRDRMLTAAMVLLAAIGIGLVAAGSGARPEAGSAAEPAADPHAAAGITGGPEVSAAFSERVSELERRVDAAPADRALRLELARLLHDGHRTREAIPHYWRAIELDRTDPTPHYDLASALGELGQWAQAREVLRARIQVAPNDATALYDLGVVEIELGEEEAAVAWWRQVVSLPDVEPTLRTRIDEALARVGAGPDPEPPR